MLESNLSNFSIFVEMLQIYPDLHQRIPIYYQENHRKNMICTKIFMKNWWKIYWCSTQLLFNSSWHFFSSSSISIWISRLHSIFGICCEGFSHFVIAWSSWLKNKNGWLNVGQKNILRIFCSKLFCFSFYKPVC